MNILIDVTPNPSRTNQLTEFTEQESVEDLLYEFLRNHTPRTALSYRNDLKAFFDFTQAHFGLPRTEGKRVHFDDIKRVHLVKYKNFLESEPSMRGKVFAPNSINRKISSISSFYQFLLQRELIDKNPAEFTIRPKRVNVRETEIFTDREMRHLFELIDEKASFLHKSALYTMFTTGLRNAELRNIKLGDFQTHEGIRILRYIGKGQKPNEVPIHPVTAHHIDQYLAWMEKIGRKVMPDDYLFQPTKNSHGGKLQKKLSHTALGYIVKKWARKVNPSKRITPHSSRATFVTSLLANGEDIYTVARCVNHSVNRLIFNSCI